MRQVKVGDSQEIADLMAHSLSTAEKHYYTRRRINTAASACKAVRSYFQSGEVSSFSTPTKIVKTSLVEDGALKVKRKKWTASEEDLLKKTFCDDIPTMSDVVEKMPILGILTTPKKVYDKLRTILRSSPAKVYFINF